MAANIIQRIGRRIYEKTSQNDSTQLAPVQHRIASLTAKFPPLHRLPPSWCRVVYYGLEQPFSVDKESMYQVNRYRVSVGNGQHIALKVYYPSAYQQSDKQRALVYFHGGGCVIGSVATHERLCRYIAKYSDLVIISVDYRLAPEAKFPVPVNDAMAAWQWITSQANELAIDINKTGVGGDSAGGYLATLIVLACQKKANSQRAISTPAFQWLLYPMVDLRTESMSCFNVNTKMLLTHDLLFYFREHYLHDLSQVDDPLVSPVLAEQQPQIVNSYVLTVEYDPLREQGICYAQRLKSLGGQVTHQHDSHSMHGFVTVAGVCPVASSTLELAVAQLVILAKKH